ncbi:MAG: hypothetical protein ACLFQ8_01620 [Candidatus Aenigmatarchaeota archaeon]
MSKKGVSDYFSHILALAITIVILSLVMSTFHDYYVDVAERSQQSEAMAVNREVGDAILNLYSTYRYRDFDSEENETLGEKTVDLPRKIAGQGYNVRLNSTGQIVVETTGFPKRTYIRSLYGIDIRLEGKLEEPGTSTVEYVSGGTEDLVKLRTPEP